MVGRLENSVNKIIIDLNGESREIWAQKISGILWVHIDGETLAFEESGSSRKRKNHESDGNTILAPMPGKISKVLKGVGETVTHGEVVIVMEAMKMEYTLKAPQAGKIDSIQCKLGDQVVLGQVLIQLEVKKQ